MIKKISSYERKPWVKVVLGLLIISAAYITKLGFIARSEYYRDILLSNADSILLPLIERSIAQHQAFHWVFSGQLLLFPEGFLYTLSTLFLRDFKLVLLINGWLNVVVLWLLVGWLLQQMNSWKFSRSLLAASLICTALLALSLFERTQFFFITQYLLTTYYSGIIIGSLIVMNLMLMQFQSSSRRTLALGSVLSFAVVSLTAFSNPLLIVQFVLAALTITALGWLINLLSGRQFWYIVTPLVLGSVVSFKARSIFSRFIGDSINSYLNFANIPHNLFRYRDFIRIISVNTLQLLELILVGSSLIILGVLLVKLLRAYTKKTPTVKVRLVMKKYFFLYSFGLFAPLFTILSTVATGSDTPRYFLPVFLFGPLTILVILITRGWKFAANHLIAPVFLLVVLCAIINIQPAATLMWHKPEVATCFDTVYKSAPTQAGVASFWHARMLGLYTSGSLQVDQVDSELSALQWLYNTDSFRNKKYSFVIVDRNPKSGIDSVSREFVINTLGIPTAISECGSIDIYTYQPGTVGYTKLNARVGAHLKNP